MPRQLTLTFSITGSCTQIIEIADDCPYTDEEIIESLNGGGDTTVCTTVQEGGDLEEYDSEGKSRALGKVVDSSMDGDYFDFEKDE